MYDAPRVFEKNGHAKFATVQVTRIYIYIYIYAFKKIITVKSMHEYCSCMIQNVCAAAESVQETLRMQSTNACSSSSSSMLLHMYVRMDVCVRVCMSTGQKMYARSSMILYINVCMCACACLNVCM